MMQISILVELSVPRDRRNALIYDNNHTDQFLTHYLSTWKEKRGVSEEFLAYLSQWEVWESSCTMLEVMVIT